MNLHHTATLTSVGDLLDVTCAAYGDAPALGGRTDALSFQDLDAVVSRIASALHQEAATGDRIAILGRNSPEQVALLLAVLRAGMTALPINWRLAPAEVAYILRHSGARLLFADEAFCPAIRALDEAQAMTVHSLDGASFAAWHGACCTSTAMPAIGRDDLALLMYTSGTTGLPKGVMLTHGNVLDSLMIMGEEPLHLGPADVVYAPAPMFHITGIGPVLRAVQTGARLIVSGLFDPDAAVRIMAHERVTYTTLAPAMIQACLAAPSLAQAPLTALRTIVYGGSPISPDTLREARAKIGCEFVQCYGLTETTGPITVLTPDDHHPDRDLLLSCGRPPAGIAVRIEGPDGAVLPVGETGEIVVSGPIVMQGYADDPDATGRTIAAGWLRSGDAGYLDADGYLFIRDRVKDMIVSGGENIYPVEVENALAAHPSVNDVAVIGVPDPRWGETVMAVIVPAKPDADPEEIMAFCRSRIAAYKCPRRIAMVDALPRNAAGKVLRRDLRAPYWQDRDRQVG
ncbi:MAG TPA: long-chain-fatty-acid--CoA ligase [Novosphingobium sp.]|nr:long-chain-fatty-acid--CoA ligase [Novosphingobium sp.]